MTVDRQGIWHPPQEEHVGHIVLMVVGMALGLISGAVGHASNWGWAGIAGFFLFPVLITLPAALHHQRTEKRYKDYQRLEAEYQARRNAIVDLHARRN